MLVEPGLLAHRESVRCFLDAPSNLVLDLGGERADVFLGEHTEQLDGQRQRLLVAVEAREPLLRRSGACSGPTGRRSTRRSWSRGSCAGERPQGDAAHAEPGGRGVGGREDQECGAEQKRKPTVRTVESVGSHILP